MCFIISSSNCEHQIQALKYQRNILRKEIRKRVNVNREKEMVKVVKGIDRLKEESKMFKAAKMQNHKRFENPSVHDEN